MGLLRKGYDVSHMYHCTQASGSRGLTKSTSALAQIKVTQQEDALFVEFTIALHFAFCQVFPP